MTEDNLTTLRERNGTQIAPFERTVDSLDRRGGLRGLKDHCRAPLGVAKMLVRSDNFVGGHTGILRQVPSFDDGQEWSFTDAWVHGERMDPS